METFSKEAERLQESLQADLTRISTDATARAEKSNEELARLERLLEGKLVEVEEQLVALRERNRLFSLADKAIVDGDRSAYDQLFEIASTAPAWWKTPLDEMRTKAAISEARRVTLNYTFWGSLDKGRIHLDRQTGSFVTLPDEALETSELMRHVVNSPYWIMRQYSAIELAKRKEKGVAEVLLECAENEERLEVLKSCIESFRRVTGSRKGGMFSYRDIRWWWTDNQKAYGCEQGWRQDCDAERENSETGEKGSGSTKRGQAQ